MNVKTITRIIYYLKTFIVRYFFNFGLSGLPAKARRMGERS